MMQPYSELANWDGSLSAPDSRSPSEPLPSSVSHSVNIFRDDVPEMLDPLQTDPNPLPLSLHDQSIYNLYHKLPQSNDHHHQASHTVAHPRPPSPHPPSAPFDLPSSDTPFLSNDQDVDVLSPQEREIMADITLDPDDPAAWATTEKGKDASGSFHSLQGEVRANMLQSRSPSVTATSQRHPTITPAPSIQPPPPRLLPQLPPPAPVASTSASVSPSPFAPRAQTTKSSSSLPSHPATKEAPDLDPVHTDSLAAPSGLDAHAGNEYVMPHATASHEDEAERLRDSPRDGSQSAIGGVQNTLTIDPPLDQGLPLRKSLEPPLATTRRSSSSRSSRAPQARSAKTPLFLPSPTESQSSSRPPSGPPLSDGDEHTRPRDIISITSSSPSVSFSPPPSRPLRRSTRGKPKAKQGRLLMAYVLVPPLPSSMRKSDYVPLEQLHREHESSDAVKSKVRVGDNSGSAALAAALQDAFKNNASSSGHTDTQIARGRRKGRGKQKAVGPVEPIEVVDDEDEDDVAEAEARNQGSTTLAHALSTAFAHNSVTPNVAPVGASGSTRHLQRGTMSVEIVVPSPAKRPRGRPRITANPDDGNDNRTVSAPASHRRSEKRQPRTPSSSQRKRRRVTRGGDDPGSEDDEGIEILDDASSELRRSPRHKPRSKADPPRLKPRRVSQYRRASMPSRVSAPAPTSGPSPSPSPSPTLLPRSPPATPPPANNALLSGHPLTILPVPSPTGIVIAQRALDHLPPSPDPPDPQSGADAAQPLQNGFLQGFHGEEAAIGAHGLLESPAAAVTPMDGGSCAIPTPTATTATNSDLHHQPLDVGLDIVVPMDIGDAEQQQIQQERQDAVRTAGVPSHALRISSSTHPDGPMLGFALSEHDDGPGPASLSADADTEASSDGFGLGPLGAKTGPDVDFMSTSLNSYHLSDGAGGWTDWGAAGPSTAVVTGDDDYVGDGTIDPSVLGGCDASGFGAGSPFKLFRSDTVRAMDVGRKEKLRDGEEEDVDVTDGEFVLPSGAGARTAVSAPGRIGAGNVRIRTKTWRKALADENGDSEDTDDAADDGDDDDVERSLDVGVARRRSASSNLPPSEASASLRLQVLSGEAITFCHHCRCKSKRPKMRCTFIRESTGVQCRKLYCDGCIEKRYPDLTFDEFATSFSCPSCQDYCNCTACSRARGEDYISERNGGWRRWGRRPGPASAAAVTADKSPSSQSRYQRRKPPQDAASASATSEVTPTLASGTQNTPSDEQLQDKATARTVSPVPLSVIAPCLPSPQQHTRRRYVYIGKRLKSWGRLVSIPDPEDQPQPQQPPRKKGKQQRKRKHAAGRVRMFAGSEEPLLLLARKKRQRATKKKNRRRRLDVLPPATPTASLPPPPPSSSPVRGGETDANGDCNADAEEGVWPGEYNYAAPPGDVVVSPRTMGKNKAVFREKAVLRMTPEEVERAIGAAFAVGGQ